MNNQSLQDQLLNAGLTSEAKAKQLRTEKRKQSKKQKNKKVNVVDEVKQLAKDAKEKQVQKDRQLNEQRNKENERKNISHQVQQLISLNKLEKDGEDDLPYHFTDASRVKTIYIAEDIRDGIVCGRLAIVKSETDYEVVSAQIAEKIKSRDEESIIVHFTENESSLEDEQYKNFQVPDDLMW